SWAGAIGLLQLLPTTAEEHNVRDLTDPVQNLYAGTKHLQWLQEYFQPVVRDSTERVKFILAAYNVGHGHVMDAIKLTEKFAGDGQKWEDVKEFLLKKSSSQYFNDPVVRFGYCRGIEPVTYVATIYSIYENYMALFPDKRDQPIENI
ncbi:MAG: transglycosylase SLT domain-containing protein, partial [Marinoscillum sp.]